MLFALVFNLGGCTVEELPVDPATVVDAALDTQVRFEPEQTWDDQLTTRDIRWRLISASPLRNSISVVGSFHITFVNADPDRTFTDFQQSFPVNAFRVQDRVLPECLRDNLFTFLQRQRLIHFVFEP